jgi:hypothetical protein
LTNESYPEPQQTATKSLAEITLRGHCPSEFRGQCGEILSLLRQHKGEWVELPHLLRIAAQYSARVFELRRAGYVIENKTGRINGQVHGWFRLVSGPGDPTPAGADETGRAQ